MDAARLRAQHMHGGGAAACLNHERPAPVRNHMKQNVMNYRKTANQKKQVEQEEAERKAQAAREGPWKMEAYKHAESKVAASMGKSSNPNSRRPSNCPTPALGGPQAQRQAPQSQLRRAPVAANNNSAAAPRGTRPGRAAAAASALSSNVAYVGGNNPVSQRSGPAGDEYFIEKNVPTWGDAGLPDELPGGYGGSQNQHADSYNNHYMAEYGSNENTPTGPGEVSGYGGGYEAPRGYGSGGAANVVSYDGHDDGHDPNPNVINTYGLGVEDVGDNSYDYSAGEAGGDGDLDMEAFMMEAEALKAKYGKPATQSVGTKKGQMISRDSKSKVPVYLQKRKAQWAADKQRELEEHLRRKSEPPPGYRVLSEEERVATLTALLEKQKEMEVAHRKLPLKIETEAQKNRQRDVQNKLKEVEEAIIMFGKPRVVVKMDA